MFWGHFWFSNHLGEEEKTACFTLAVCASSFSSYVGFHSVIVAFFGKTYLFVGFSDSRGHPLYSETFLVGK